MPDDPERALLAFINACLDEDEAAARAATPGPWQWNDDAEDGYGYAPDWAELMSRGRRVTSVEGQFGIRAVDARHIAAWDPARVLDEVAAKRRMLREMTDHAPPWADSRSQEIYETIADEVLPCLAWPYRHRPGWDPSWAPDEMES